MNREEIYNLIHYANKRIVQAEHYGIPYDRPEYLPPQTAYSRNNYDNYFGLLRCQRLATNI